MSPEELQIAEFNSQRVELWQMQLGIGDCFAVVIQPGVIFYGYVVGMVGTARERAVRLFCEATPDGADDILQVHMVDLPMTRRQFRDAREFGWPSCMTVLRQLVGMAKPASA